MSNIFNLKLDIIILQYYLIAYYKLFKRIILINLHLRNSVIFRISFLTDATFKSSPYTCLQNIPV